MAYRLTSRAAREFIDIYTYGVENFGVPQAERYAAGFRTAFEVIASWPLMCRERREFRPVVRMHVHLAHAIVYLVENGDVMTVRILHRSQDLRKHL